MVQFFKLHSGPVYKVRGNEEGMTSKWLKGMLRYIPQEIRNFLKELKNFRNVSGVCTKYQKRLRYILLEIRNKHKIIWGLY